MLEPIEYDIEHALGGDMPLCFLVGAGISMDPPARLGSARQLMDGIIRFAAPADAVDSIQNIPDLRYECLVEQMRYCIDKDLEFYRHG